MGSTSADRSRPRPNISSATAARPAAPNWVTGSPSYRTAVRAVEPVRAVAGMAVYAVIVNGPCIIAQRYNRLRISRVLAARANGWRPSTNGSIRAIVCPSEQYA